MLHYSTADTKEDILSAITVFITKHEENVKMVKFNKTDFIKKAEKIHNKKYNYSLVDYINSQIKIKIICPIHGDFEQKPAHHLRGQGCVRCAGLERKTTEQFIKEASKVHNGKYDYSLVNYKNSDTKVKIICSIHGEFEQNPDNHVNKNIGCPKCSNEKKSLKMLSSTEEFIKKANIIHNNFYSYEKSQYISARDQILITCPKHGDFSQTVDTHLSGAGCFECGKQKIVNFFSLTQEEFIQRAKIVHGNLYSYDKVVYIKGKNKVIITCPVHGDFHQLAVNHLLGRGCPVCNSYSKAEEIMVRILNKYNINFQYQKTFENFRNKDTGYLLRFDFYFPLINTIVEYDGKQHFEPIEYWGGLKNLKLIQERDKLKSDYCLKNNINLLRISYKDKHKIEEILIMNGII
jgi:hypothetical protein